MGQVKIKLLMCQSSQLNTTWGEKRHVNIYMNTDLSSEEIPGREAFGKGWRARLLLSCPRDPRPSYNWPRAILGKLLYNKQAVRQSHHHTQLTAQKRPDKRRQAHGTFRAVIGRRHTPSRNLFRTLCDHFSFDFSSFSLSGRGDM